MIFGGIQFILVLMQTENEEVNIAMGSRFRNFMSGRYGNDQLNRLMVVIAVIGAVLTWFLHSNITYIISIVFLILAYVRMFSRNIQQRSAENARYLEFKDRFLGIFRGRRGSWGQQSAYKIFICPGCGQKIRIPKGKGHIMITCPRCHTSFKKRT